MTDEFWSSRPALQHVLTLARARGVGPWATLGAVLARAIATVPPEICLPGIVGSRMSLNLFIALVGPSGGGKGAAEAAALDGFSLPYVEIVPLGSGEGINRTFRPVGTKPDEPNPVTAAIFSAAEIDTVAAVASRQGSTLSSELRKVYSGEQLGFANAGKDTRSIVAAGSYRACLTIGVQPLRSHTLLGASDGGLPQRFVWLPTSDPDAPDEPPPDPGKWKVSRPSWLRAIGSTVDLIVPETASKAIRAHRLAVLREDPHVDPLDGHALLTRLKVAAALMALDGRTVVSAEDWSLAGYVMDVSNYTRERCQRALAEQSRSANAGRALAAADREEIISDRKLQRAKEAILRKMADGRQLPRHLIRTSLKADLRDYFGPALDALLTEREITVSPGRRETQKVHLYQRYRPQKRASASADKTCTKSTGVPPGERSTPTTQSGRRRRTHGNYRNPQQTGEATA
ncbi:MULTISPECIES: hypothetical protein [Mycobacterium avium complex (MAC)]|nr:MULTISPECIES: hypothetical protein [Mycobacterium avium complex (MAC)]ETB35614.1 hypothetical protein N602_26335 [Mycobacterium avium subsp. hominissuis 10-5606]MCA4759830.1 hypothetical protein [Mycobacterium avium subsp. hominissuis]MDV3247532.1 hypothetical protein [Mycobacterium avium subsp. hominissuis]MDV3273883.1 hypothetical protein [Mycobacterium avium subsp. hominissuis]MDV3321610.1 hypothetical protein [Mycobacterium avium subsp. hominissuis]